jgi:Leucine Rich repeat
MIPANSTVEPSIDDPEELAYLHNRRVARRRQLVSILAIATLVIGFVTWKAAKHLTSTWWLEANHFVVLWGIDQDNWKQGGSTTVRYKGQSWYLVISEPQALDLRHLRDLHRIEELDLASYIGIRDSDIQVIDELRSLRRLNLNRSRLSDWGRQDPGLLTDATLRRIGRLDQLIELNLGFHRITDAGLKSLEGLDHLENLGLCDTEITDEGLEPLKALKGLKSLDLSGTRVTPEGIAEFEKARPLVKVLADPPTPRPAGKSIL